MTTKVLATHKVAALLIGVASVVAVSFAFVTTAKADAVSDLQAQVQALLAQIASLSGGSTTATTGTGFTFTRNLKMGDNNTYVKISRLFLTARQTRRLLRLALVPRAMSRRTSVRRPRLRSSSSRRSMLRTS